MIIPAAFVSPASTLSAGAAFAGGNLALLSAATPLAAQASSTAISMSMSAAASVGGGIVLPAVSTALSLCGGAAAKKGVLDLARVRLRLDGLHSYAVIASLLMNCGLRLYSSTPKRTKDATNGLEFFENAVKFVFTCTMLVSVMCGSCTSILFSLLGLYSKRALGRGNDAKFLEFFEATEGIRYSGYQSFLVALVAFEASFVLSLFLNYRGWPRWFFLVASISLSYWAMWHWVSIIHLASAILDFS